jgi:hypothetical protein
MQVHATPSHISVSVSGLILLTNLCRLRLIEAVCTNIECVHLHHEIILQSGLCILSAQFTPKA